MSTSTPTPAPVGLEPEEEVDNRRVLVVIAGLLTVVFLAALDQTIIATALPTIVGDLGGLEHISWVVTAYLLAQTVAMPLYGKLGDLYGRKRVLQAAIVIFLLGSVLAGLSQSMGELIAFRALQGLGGGGLMVSAQAALGDVVSPRRRGRFTGLFGAAFGLASVAGPLLGGALTDALSWRWTFYVNLPVGVVAFLVLAAVLPAGEARARRQVDWAGSALLALGLSAAVLVTTLGGASFGWASPEILGLLALAALAFAGFWFVERRAEEPVLAPSLLGNAVIRRAGVIAAIVGFAMFGAVTYLPLFQQVVRGASPTSAGLQLLPLMGGLLVASILTGQTVSRTGRYRVFPIVGTALTVVGLALLAGVGEGTSTPDLALRMLVLGVGIGMTMQVLVLVSQNAVAHKDVGVATAAASLFRSVGGSLGTAVLGAVFAARLTAELAGGSLAGRGLDANADPTALAALPPADHAAYLDAFSGSMQTVFLVGAGVALLAAVLAWFLPNLELRTTIATREDLLAAAQARRDAARAVLTRLADRAGVDLSPGAAWLVSRLAADPAFDPAAFAASRPDVSEPVTAAAEEARREGLVIGADLTPAGAEIARRLDAARRGQEADILSAVPEDRRADARTMLDRMAPAVS